MIRLRVAAVCALAVIVVTGCSQNPQRLPIAVFSCRIEELATGSAMVAGVENRSDRPIARLEMTSSFYRDFRYRRLDGFAQLDRELDPGQRRDVVFHFEASATGVPSGPAARCFVTHIGYLDGTAADAP